MPEMTPVGTMFKPPDPNAGLNTYSNILSIQGQQQNLKLQAQQVQQQQIQTSEMQAIQDIGKNPPMNAEGTAIDPDAFLQQITRKAPNFGLPKVDSLLGALQKGQNLKNSYLATDTSLQNEIKQIAGGWSTYSPDKAPISDLTTQLDNWADTRRDSYPKVVRMKEDFLKMLGVLPDPAHQKMFAQEFGRGSLDQNSLTGPTGLGTANASGSYTNAAGQSQSFNTNPNAPGGIADEGQPRNQGVNPQFVTGADGQIHFISGMNGSPNQGAEPPTSKPGVQQNPQSPQPSSRELPSLSKPNWNDATAQETYRSQMKDSGEHYRSLTSPQGGVYDPQNGTLAQRYRNAEIIRAVNSGISTGSGSDTLNNFVSMLPKSFQTKGSDNYQIAGSFLADKIGANMANMGLSKSNAGQNVSEAGGGSLKSNPEALKEIVKVSDATNTARDMYVNGLNIVTRNGQDMSKVPAFKAAWQRNFDINIFRHMDAVRRGDQNEEESAQSSRLSPSQLKQLAIKAKNLNSLSNQGLLAQ
jgi:hypothetical protein